MDQPKIGITTSLETDRNGNPIRQTLNHEYVRAVERSGAIPLLLPMTDGPDAFVGIETVLDGLVITGGPGITHGLVGNLPDDLSPVSTNRDKADTWAFNTAQKKQIPILGICYGMQFINAQFGGSLFGDIYSQFDSLPHSSRRNSGKEANHTVTVEPGTHLYDLMERPDEPIETNSRHLQAIDTIGKSLRVNARSEDRVIEGIESEDGRILAVQFHPEGLAGSVWDNLFEHLTRRATNTI